ncbi:MAG: hypothetical protein D3904_05745, partial [Candidatus Electrothrix sp. EH2]|nr:hypothetical protein [Candidatus Electrothrix sp. EH2]
MRFQNDEVSVGTLNEPKTLFMLTQQKTDWHRLLGLIFIDFFTGSAWTVELEKDLSMKKQLLDIIILRRDAGESIDPLPDGLEGMKKHNLLFRTRKNLLHLSLCQSGKRSNIRRLHPHLVRLQDGSALL